MPVSSPPPPPSSCRPRSSEQTRQAMTPEERLVANATTWAVAKLSGSHGRKTGGEEEKSQGEELNSPPPPPAGNGLSLPMLVSRGQGPIASRPSA